MTRTPAQIKADIESHEAALEDLRAALKEAENQPKPGDVFVDQNGRVYIATERISDPDGTKGPALWIIGGTGWDKTGAYHATYEYWIEGGRMLTKVSAGGISTSPFNALTTRA